MEMETRRWDARRYVGIPAWVRLAEWGVVNALVPRVFGWLDERGVSPAGPLLYRYLSVPEGDGEYEVHVGVSVTADVAPDGEVVVAEIPAGRYVVATHHGHPDGLFGVEAELRETAAGEGRRWDVRVRDGREYWGGRFEFFHTDPAVTPDLDEWRTEVAYRLADLLELLNHWTVWLGTLRRRLAALSGLPRTTPVRRRPSALPFIHLMRPSLIRRQQFRSSESPGRHRMDT
ncbi:effector-binding domain-containing protein [Stackebrandtia albiflava]|uniref:Effector-binding domain-containing protein n=1 Tax=Stackebrandtia albiflava TaxID=406432 RepID=A0A562VDY9_9ACTN|nr:GyrI-like domain-containing protein [Stackebrandtia albiflava]TWJ16099.1 effector-binding domain-containing protein [Stackebrandtia albiflava]